MSTYTLTKAQRKELFEITLFRDNVPIDRHISYSSLKVNRIYDKWRNNFNAIDLSAPPVVVSRNVASFTAASLQYLSRANPPLLTPGAIPFTVMAWVKLNGVIQQAFLGKYQPATNQREWLLYYNTIYFAINTSLVGTAATTLTFNAITPVAGQWYFVMGGWDGVNTWISVNGLTRIIVTFAGPLVAGSAEFEVGASNGGISNLLDGALGPIAYWNADLSSLISVAYNGGISLRYSELPTSLLTNLVGWWNLNESAGAVRKDSTANHLDLTDHNNVGSVAGPP